MVDLEQIHTPVLVCELLEQLDLSQSDTVIDATLGFGGHAEAILKRLGQQGRLIGMERDPEVFARVAERFGQDSRVFLCRDSFARMRGCAREHQVESADAVYFDLGLSSYHLDKASRGFSFQREDEPLDCRFDPTSDRPTAAEWLNHVSPKQLRSTLRESGEVRRLHRVTRALLETRPVETVGDVVRAVEGVYPPHKRQGGLARLFQAFRIEVNDELSHLKEGLRQALSLLCPGGKMGVISFHSLEDRIVKEFFRHEQRACVCPPDLPVCACDKQRRCRILTQSPIRASAEEVQNNPRARSARLRVAERVGPNSSPNSTSGAEL